MPYLFLMCHNPGKHRKNVTSEKIKLEKENSSYNDSRSTTEHEKKNSLKEYINSSFIQQDSYKETSWSRN
jgi:hypothetical protein